MKVVRLKSGYRITCTDSEFEALCLVVQVGQDAAQKLQAQSALSSTARSKLRREPFTGPVGPLRITDDRRG